MQDTLDPCFGGSVVLAGRWSLVARERRCGNECEARVCACACADRADLRPELAGSGDEARHSQHRSHRKAGAADSAASERASERRASDGLAGVAGVQRARLPELPLLQFAYPETTSAYPAKHARLSRNDARLADVALKK